MIVAIGIVILCVILIAVLFVAKSNVASTSKDEHNSLYAASYIPGPWSSNVTEGNIVLVNPTNNSLSNLNITISVDSSGLIVPSLRLWYSDHTVYTPNSMMQSEDIYEDMQKFSTPITSISIEPNQKETISLSFPSPESFEFSSHNLTIYISQNSFGDIINGTSLTVPQTEAYLQVVRYSSVEFDSHTYHEYFNSTLNDYVYINDNPNFCQRYFNFSWQVYTDTYHLMSRMNALDETYFNVTVFNNNTFPVNSVTLLGQIPSQGSFMNWWRALRDYVMQPNETYLFPVSSTEIPHYAYAIGYVTNSTLQVSNSQSTPKLSVLSPLNQTYNESSVSLVFTVAKPVNWTGYSLDGSQNVTIAGNETVTNIPNGSHNITVYANDTYGNMGASETIYFTIAEPFPTSLVATASGVSVAAIGLGLLVYFKKRKH